jgi:hypothetical protein
MNVEEALHHAATEKALSDAIDALARVGVAAEAEHALEAKSIGEVGELIARKIYRARDEIRLVLWIVAHRNGGVLRISRRELLGAPCLPGLTTYEDGDERVFVAHPPEDV